MTGVFNAKNAKNAKNHFNHADIYVVIGRNDTKPTMKK